MKTLIYQVKVGTPPAFYDTCIDSVKRYCAKYNINHIIQKEPILKIRPLNSCRSGPAVERLGYLPIYEKENAFNYLGEYDKICIVDADIYIRDTAPNIFDEIDLETPFAGVRECDMPLTPQYFTKIEKFSRGQYETFPDIIAREYTKEYYRRFEPNWCKHRTSYFTHENIIFRHPKTYRPDKSKKKSKKKK